jgi:hypothetical protein
MNQIGFGTKSKLKWILIRLRTVSTVDLSCGDKRTYLSNPNSESKHTIKDLKSMLPLSPKLFYSMTDSALRNSDSCTLTKLLDQVSSIDGFDNSVEKALLFYLWEKDYANAIGIFKASDPDRVRISEATCHHLMSEVIEQMHWDAAYVVVARMVSHNYKISDRVISSVMAGLMGTTEGVKNSLHLLQLIIINRRSDLARSFVFRPVCIFIGGFLTIFNLLCSGDIIFRE